VGSLLGDADVWDDTPAPPRPLRRGVVAAAAGVALGLAVGWAVAPRPAPPAPVVSLPPVRAADAEGSVLPQGGELLEQAALAGPMVVAGPGRVDAVKPDGTGRQALSSSFVPAAVLPARGGAPVVALGGGAVTAIDRNGTTTPLTKGGFQAGGIAGRGGRVLACGRRPLPLDQRLAARAAGRDETAAAPAQLLPAKGGKGVAVGLGCPVSWAAGADVVAGAGGPQVPFRRTTRGGSVLVGRAGGPLRTLLDRGRLESATGPGASVGAVAVSPDGELVAVAAGVPGGRWALLLAPVGGGAVRRIELVPGYEAAWLSWMGQNPQERRLAMAAVDRRGGLAEASLASRAGGGYVLGWDEQSGVAATILAGPAMERADGFAFSPDGQFLAVSSPGGWTLLRTAQPSERGALPVGGTLLAWPGAAP
jgi:hypothetical protein